MTASRRTSIELAYTKAHQPRPAPRVAQGMTDLQIAGEVARREKQPAVGGMTKLLYALPPNERGTVRAAANIYAHERDLGRHGNKQRVLDHFAVQGDVAEAVVNGLEVDYVAAELQRRRGSDADRPMPDLTRRDYISAAVDAHTPSASSSED